MSEQAPSLDPGTFKAVFRQHPAGVAVITADAGDGPVGLTASSVISVSAEPPLLAFSVSNHSSSAPSFRKTRRVVVHLIGAEQLNLAHLCASDPGARFLDPGIWARLETGDPYYPSADNWILGEVMQRHTAGSASVFVVRALAAKPKASKARDAASAPLVYHDREWHRLSPASSIRMGSRTQA